MFSAVLLCGVLYLCVFLQSPPCIKIPGVPLESHPAPIWLLLTVYVTGVPKLGPTPKY